MKTNTVKKSLKQFKDQQLTTIQSIEIKGGCEEDGCEGVVAVDIISI